MPLDKTIRNVLVLGSGPVVIGQAAEFDYSGSQACLALREEGIRTVLLNPNPATIQTDHYIADRVYIEPISRDMIQQILVKENIDSVMSSFGGQTALNAVVDLFKEDNYDHKIRALGTSPEHISMAEDRRLFHRLMREIGEPIPESYILESSNYHEILKKIGESSYIVRTSFSLGGSGGTVVETKDKLLQYAENHFSENPDIPLEVEQSVAGLKEIEFEIIRDSANNCIAICNMENIDPMGIHTGESIVVTPSQTLSDIELQMLRSSSLKIVRSLKILGACNVQFAIDSETREYFVIEVNPRTSRSSALASKASGYPIARISAKIQLGYILPEIKNPLIGHTSAAFEPSLDYITVKIPRWPFDKIAGNRDIGVQMRSVGEVMGIGSTFEEALLKAIVSLDTFESRRIRLYKRQKELSELLKKPNDLRLFAVFEALITGISSSEVSDLTGFDPYFVEKIARLCSYIKSIGIGDIPENIRELKETGFPDSVISHFAQIPELQIVRYRLEHGIIPSFRNVDTCSAEFESTTPYLYSTYSGTDDVVCDTEEKKVLILGSGPNRIAQGLEFDFGAVKASRSFMDLGYETVMVNCNPETVSTDFDFSSKLYFEPLTLEHVANIVAVENISHVMVQFSGQTGQNLSITLSEIFGEDLFIGTKPGDILEIEDRGRFAESLQKMGINQPPFVVVSSEMEADSAFDQVGFPVIIRSSFIIGGRSMDIVLDRDYGLRRVRELLETVPEHPVLISHYVENATEIDVDFLSDGENHLIGGISVHIEEAGTHSGDAISVIGPRLLKKETVREIDSIVSRLTRHFHLKGISNLQLAINESGPQIIELNARSSRSLPYVCKATGRNLVDTGIKMALGMHLQLPKEFKVSSYFSKIPVFPFKRFPDTDVLLSPEMKSTGEGLGIGKTLDESILKAFIIQNPKFSPKGGCIISVNDRSKRDVVKSARSLLEAGHVIFATPGTHSYLRKNGINSVLVFRIEDRRRPNLRDIIENQEIFAIVNVPNITSGALADGFQIRRMAMNRNIPVITNVRAANALITALTGMPSMSPRELSEYN